MLKNTLRISFFLLLAGAGCSSRTTTYTPTSTFTAATAKPTNSFAFALPIDRATERVTKKSFGTFVTPENSPVQPERFRGYHTGTDFEIFSDEADKPVNILVICSGKIIKKNWVSGYGGVVVESCELENKPITVLYGHMNLASIKIKLNEAVNAGAELGQLGKGYSTETDGERKHLHLSIHHGTNIDVRGYVQQKSELSQWIDFGEYLK